MYRSPDGTSYDFMSYYYDDTSWEVLVSKLKTTDSSSSETKTFIVNDDLDKALSEMKAILTAERCRRIRQSKMPLK